MQKLVITIVTAAVFASAAFAQSPAAGSATAPQSSTSAQTGGSMNGSATGDAAATGQASSTSQAAVQNAVLGAELSKSIDAKKAKEGDQVTAKTMADATTSAGTKIPKNTKLIGHITEVKAKGKGDAQSTLGFVFDKAVLKGGQEVPLHAVVQAVAAAPQATLNPGADTAADTGGMGSSAPNSSGAMGSRGNSSGGVVGNAANTVGSAANTATGAVGSAAGEATGAAGQASNGGVALTSTSTGVMGIKGVQLQQSSGAGATATMGSGAGSVPVLTSTSGNVHLDSGTQLVLKSSAASSNSSVGVSTTPK